MTDGNARLQVDQRSAVVATQGRPTRATPSWHQREASGGKLKPRTWAEHTTRKSCSMNQSEIGGETRKQKDQQASVIETHGDDGPSANLGPWTLVDLT